MEQHQPLSASLQAILQHESARDKLTLNFLLEQTEGRGIYLVFVLLALPSVYLPGVSVALGVVLMVLALAHAFNKPARLPKFVGDRALPKAAMNKVLGASVRLLRFVEKIVKPRRTPWMSWRAPRAINGLIIAWMAFLLALPIPPVPVPFTNMFPGYAIVLMAVAMMEEDGVMIWLGYAASAWTTAYFVFFFGFISATMLKLIHSLAK
ncbi:MAG: Exopolysaccharide synthesis ExoD [Verrucomicrobiales bacterium]|nr:Exopolysaccharide synthesis ExoD [Verrucomicrobiales bacterium]